MNYHVSMLSRHVLIVALTALIVTGGCGSPAPVDSSSGSLVDQDAANSRERTNPSTDSQSAPSTQFEREQSETSPAGVPSLTDNDNSAAPADRFRPPDLRPQHDVAKVAAHGIRRFESRRLQLYTDIEPEAAASLPPLVDAVFDEWQNYFGPLPPARDGSDFQLSAYLMRDQQRFRDAGLLPVDVPVFAHGKHQGHQFWMNDQEHAYYRGHLLLHEATHCYMQAMGGTTIDVPLWYLEGMAELFATHRVDEDGRPSFRVIPSRPEDFVGFGRIEMIRRDIEREEALTMTQLADLTPRRFRRRQAAYAWSWTICLLADRNPKYRELFQQLGRQYPAEGFHAAYETLFAPIAADFEAEWTLFTRELQYGFDIPRAAIEFQHGTRLTESISQHQASVIANRGWQSSGVEVVQDQTYRVMATERVTLADEPKPWVSEPDGVTIRYAAGRPLGRLLGVVIGEPDAAMNGKRLISDVISLGQNATFTSPTTGTLYLRVNDFWDELADNEGEYSVTIAQ